MTVNVRKDDLVVQETGDELLIYDLKTNKAICLNKTSAIIWKHCDGKKSVREIAESVEGILGGPIKDEFIWFAIDQLKRENLLELPDNSSNIFAGLSRREIIKRIGFASAVALPIISSLTVPVAAQIQSCPPAGTGMANIPAGSGCPCVQPQDCSSGTCFNGTMTC